MLLFAILAQINRLIWFQYTSTGCLTCHTTPILKINDTTYVLGSLHYSGGYQRVMLMGIKVKQGIEVQWYKAFTSNPNFHLDVSALAKVNDTLIAVAGGHGGGGGSFIGLFNLNTKNFIWTRYFSNKRIVKGIAFDGSNLVAAIQGHNASGRGAVVKVNLNGNLIWGKEVYFGCSWNDNYSIIPEATGYVVMGIGWWCSNWQPVIYRISLDGSSATLIRGFSNSYRAYKLIKDGDGNYVLIGFWEPSTRAYLTKLDAAGNIIYSKQYASNNDLRFYDITLDLDGNYLVAGHVRIGSATYPMAAKINKNDGNVIWGRYWNGAPNQAHNQAKGIIPIKPGKILVAGYLGTSVDEHNGFVAILDSIDCMIDLPISVSNLSLSNWSPSISLSNYTNINNLTLTSYNFSLASAPSCQITPVSDNEYKSCNFRIYAGKGFIAIKSEKEIKIEIYNINGTKVKEVVMKEGKINLKSGIYIVRVENERLKLIVN